MTRSIAVAAFALVAGPAFAQNAGPAPQTGMERPENTNGATEKGSMDTTGMNVNRANEQETKTPSKNPSKGTASKDDTKK